MKKIIALILVIATAVGIFSGCATKKMSADEILKVAVNNLANEYKPTFAEDVEKAVKDGYVTFNVKISQYPSAFEISGEYSSAGDIAFGMTGLDKKYGLNLKTAKEDLKTSEFRAYDENPFGIDKAAEDSISNVLDIINKIYDKKIDIDYKPYIKDVEYNTAYASAAIVKCDVIHLSMTKKEFVDFIKKELEGIKDVFKNISLIEIADIEDTFKDVNDDELLIAADVVTDVKTHDLLYAEIRADNVEKHEMNTVASVAVTALSEGSKKFVCTIYGKALGSENDTKITLNTVKSEKAFEVNVAAKTGDVRVMHAELKIDKQAKTIKVSVIGEDGEDKQEFTAKYDVKKENTYTEVSVETDMSEGAKITVSVAFHKDAYKSDYINLLKTSADSITSLLESLSNVFGGFFPSDEPDYFIHYSCD